MKCWFTRALSSYYLVIQNPIKQNSRGEEDERFQENVQTLIDGYVGVWALFLNLDEFCFLDYG